MSCCSTCQNVTCQCSNGVNGKNIWTVTTANFTQPLAGNQVIISVSSTQQLSNQGFGIGQVIYIENGGYYEVISIASLTSMTIENLGYTGNAAPASNIASGSKVSPGGLIGQTGPAGTPAVNGTTLLYNDNTPVVSGGATPSSLHTYTVAAGELARDGDALRVKSVVTTRAPFSGTVETIAFRVDGNVTIIAPFLSVGNSQLHFDILISRVSDTSLNVTGTIVSGLNSPAFVPVGVNGGYSANTIFSFENVTVLDVDTNPFVIDIYETRSDVTDIISSQYLTVEKLVI